MQDKSGIILNTVEKSTPNQKDKRKILVIVILGFALIFRFYGISNESFWTDEVLTDGFSQKGVSHILEVNARDCHPPLYYLLIYIYRGIIGDSEIALRSYSSLWSLLGIFFLFLLAREIGGWRVGIISLILSAVNPLDICFAQEARMYSQAVSISTIGSYFLWRWINSSNKDSCSGRLNKWRIGYTICAIAMLYTHYVTIIILLAQGIFALVLFSRRRQWINIIILFETVLLTGLIFLPWYAYVLGFRDSLYNIAVAWIGVIPIQDCFLFLGREFFWGHLWEMGDILWLPTLILPAFILYGYIRVVMKVQAKDISFPITIEEPRLVRVLYPLWLLFGPVLIAMIITRIYYPVYFPRRFSLFILPQFLILAGIACCSFRKKIMTWLFTSIICAVMFAGTIAQYFTNQKIDWREFAKVWKEEPRPAKIVFFPYYLWMTADYYTKGHILSASKEELEKLLPYLADSEIWVCWDKDYTYRSWKGEFEYYHWLNALGTIHEIPLTKNRLRVRAIKIGNSSVPEDFRKRFAQWFGPFDIPGRITGFEDASQFYTLECEPPKKIFIWSKSESFFSLEDNNNIDTVVLNVQYPPPVPSDYKPELKIYIVRSEDSTGLFDHPPVKAIDNFCPGEFEIELSEPEGSGKIWIGWTINPVNLKRAKVTNDARDLGLRINWIGLLKSSKNISLKDN